jgi:hypothetical protein
MSDEGEAKKPSGGETGKAADSAARRSRRAQALRDNLKKRKEQARARTRRLVEPPEPR